MSTSYVIASQHAILLIVPQGLDRHPLSVSSIYSRYYSQCIDLRIGSQYNTKFCWCVVLLCLFLHTLRTCASTVHQAVRSTDLFKLENRKRSRLVQKPKWTRLRGKSENVYSGTRTFWFFRDRSNIKSVYRSTHFHFCPSNLVHFGFCTNLVRFRFSSLNKLFARTVR